MIRTDIVIPEVLKNCSSAAQWRSKRADILKSFAEIEYGKRPQKEYQVTWEEEVRETVEELDAIHIRTKLKVKTDAGEYSFPVTVFLPVSEEKVPAALLICSQQRKIAPMQLPAGMEGRTPAEIAATFQQMFAHFKIIMDDPSQLAAMLPGSSKDSAAQSPVPLDLDRDYDNGHWPVREMMGHKTAMIGFYANDAEADNAASYPSGLAAIFSTSKERAAQDWGILAVWAFAASCVMDYIEQLPEVDPARVAVTGHSRCGKAALWCGANDERFYAVMPNGSGCCGAALSRGKTGENLASIQAFFPHWFAPAFREYAGREAELPFDQHFLLAAVAPRILHVGSGSEDAWADPQGEHYSTFLASRVWELYGPCDFEEAMPSENSKVISGNVGYHLRKGPHKLDTFDWICLWEHMNI